jgi:uncharacterized protein
MIFKAFIILISLCGVYLAHGLEKDTIRPGKSIGHAELYWLMNRACSYGDEIGVEMLLNAGADPDGAKDFVEFRRFEPSWPINQAARGGHIDIVKMLLKAGARVDAPEGEGYTALIFASLNNHSKLVQLLILEGANTSYKSPKGNALEIAKSKGFIEVVNAIEQATKTMMPGR